MSSVPELGGELMERRRVLESEGESMKEWKILFDKTVEDNSIPAYVAATQDCTEFYVSIFFANDSDITDAINGCISLNTNNPWTNSENRISNNIPTLKYNSHGNNNKAVVFRFEVVNGYIIPKGQFCSYNTGASSTALVSLNSIETSILLFTEDGKLRHRQINGNVEKIAVGSYTGKYFGVGTKILIMGR